MFPTAARTRAIEAASSTFSRIRAPACSNRDQPPRRAALERLAVARLYRHHPRPLDLAHVGDKQLGQLLYGNGYAEDMAADALIASAEIGLTAATASAPSAQDAGQNPAESDIPKSGNLAASGGPLSSGSGQSTPPAPSDPAMPGLGNPGTGKAVAGGQPSSSGNRKSAAPTGGKAPLSGPGKPKESPPSLLALLTKKAPPAPKVILGPFDD
jgi:hypothetical protein